MPRRGLLEPHVPEDRAQEVVNAFWTAARSEGNRSRRSVIRSIMGAPLRRGSFHLLTICSPGAAWADLEGLRSLLLLAGSQRAPSGLDQRVRELRME